MSATDDDIVEIVKQFGFVIPKSLIWFLKTFGATIWTQQEFLVKYGC
jgi:hypothetical protein